MAMGDVEFKGEDGKTFILNFGTNAMCRLEKATGKTYGQVCDELRAENPPIMLARHFVQASLVEPKGLTEEQAGDVLDAIGGPAQILTAFRRASTPAPKAETAANG
jgi:hypothetical protein